MRFIIGISLLAATAFLLPIVLEAQQQPAAAVASPPEFDLAFTYSAQRSNIVNTGNIFWPESGGTAELSALLSHGFGLAANLGGAHASNIVPGVDLTMITATFGPRYTWSHALGGDREKRIRFFGQALVGVSFGMDSEFPFPSGVKSSAHCFALQVGGGVDLALWRHVALRPLQADWLRTEFPNFTTGVQNNMRLSAGIVFRFP